MMNKACNLITAATLLLIAAQQNCLATDYDPITPGASSVSGAGGDNSGQVTNAIRQSKLLSEDSKQVNVAYKHGAIIISGTVASDRDREEIGTIAEKCGCVNVRNEVTVQGADSNKTVHQAETITVKHKPDSK